MHHAFMYHGAFEANFPSLQPGATTYRATDGTERPVPSWPAGIDGLRVGYMERAGKKFFAVRLRFEDQDVVLRVPVLIDALRHLGNRRLSPKPTLVTDEMASFLLDDAIGLNPSQDEELALLVNRVNRVRRGDGPLL
jgi:hypothetical protein